VLRFPRLPAGKLLCPSIVATVLLGVAFPATAQEIVTTTTDADNAESKKDKKVEDDGLVAGDPEAGPGPVAEPEADERLKMDFRIRSEVHSYDNLDLRLLDETTDQDIIDTDDRHVFGYSGISARLSYQVRRDLDVYVGLAHNGLWGEDQLGQNAKFGGALNFSHLAFDYRIADTDGFKLSLSMGRQPFKIGGVPTDFMLDDILDAVVLTADMGSAGAFRWLALDYYTANDLPSASFVSYVGGRETSLGLRGDTYTLRTGLIYENEDDAVEGLTVKAYWFYADVGGGPISEAGADYAEGGALGNFSDNDFTHMAGGRGAYKIDLSEGSWLNFYGESAYSWGIDRKSAVARDVETVGLAYGGGLEADFGPVYVAADFYHFDGANYAGDGLEFERGFVSFKGKRVGGLNLNRYAGWSPSSYLGRGGAEHNPHDTNRAGGTQTIHAALALEMDDFTLRLDGWHLTDTSETFLSLEEIDGIDPPFGYSREEFLAASGRSGKALGTEIDVQAIVHAGEGLSFFTHYGLFLPGEFFEFEIDKVAGTALGGTESFWAVAGGATVEF
jgi:hypothetical protein